MRNISCRGLHKSFGDFVAVRDLSVDIMAGEFVSILGPSGCGKTTTLRMLAGLERPLAGEIWIGDEAVAAPAARRFVPPEKRGVGMVFQSYAIWPHLTVGQNIEYPLKLRKLPKRERVRQVDELLSLVGLHALADRAAAALSGGQQQRVALARAVAGDPNVLLLDEPLSNLDAKLRTGLRIELQGLQRRLGTTTVYVTHDQTEALALSDRVIVMNAGEVQQDGTPEEIYERPANRFVAEFIGELSQLGGTVDTRNGTPVVVIDGAAAVAALQTVALPAGQRATVAFRPERVRVSGDAPADLARAGLCLDVVVDARMYLGEQQHCVLRAGDQRVAVYVDRKVSIEVGDHLVLYVDSEDLMVFPEPAAESDLKAHTGHERATAVAAS